jgi:hypothetical protein
LAVAQYAPVWEFHKMTLAGFESSCSRTLNTVTGKEQDAVLPAASVAVQVTVVIPSGKQVPDGGLQLIETPGQLSDAVGVENVTFTQVAPGAAGAPPIPVGQVPSVGG